MVTNKDIITPPDIRHREYADLLFSGLSQREAYIKVYNPVSEIQDIDSNASRLTRHEKVQGRLRELEDEAAKKLVAAPLERLKKLTEYARVKLPDEALTPAHQLQAIDLMNKMNRLYSDNVTINFNEIKISLVEDEPCNMAIEGEIVDGSKQTKEGV